VQQHEGEEHEHDEPAVARLHGRSSSAQFCVIRDA
jgi:hypothetical protein